MINLAHVNRLRRKYDPDNKYNWLLAVDDGQLVLDITCVASWGRATVSMPADQIYSIRHRITKQIKKLEKMAKVLEQDTE